MKKPEKEKRYTNQDLLQAYERGVQRGRRLGRIEIQTELRQLLDVPSYDAIRDLELEMKS